METNFKKKSGDTIDVLLSCAPLDPDDISIGITMTVLDITEQKKNEEALKLSEEKYRSFIQNFQGVAFQAYRDNSIDFIHGAVKEITGYTQEDFNSGRIYWNQLIHD